MKRGFIVVVSVILIGLAGFWVVRSQKAARHQGGPIIDSMPELTWVRNELKLDDAQFEKVGALHRAYRPKCADMCRRLSLAHEKVETLAEAGNGMTPELEVAIKEHAQVHAECQRAMLEHLYQTAELLHPSQAARYLEIMVPEAIDSTHPASGAKED